MTTPGPWEAVERIDGYWEVRGDHADCAEGVPLRQEDDVRLMARAPDLLAALATARSEASALRKDLDAVGHAIGVCYCHDLGCGGHGPVEEMVRVVQDTQRERVEAMEESSALRKALREVLPDTMGGTPGRFWPEGGWDAWAERARALLAGKGEAGT